MRYGLRDVDKSYLEEITAWVVGRSWSGTGFKTSMRSRLWCKTWLVNSGGFSEASDGKDAGQNGERPMQSFKISGVISTVLSPSSPPADGADICFGCSLSSRGTSNFSPSPLGRFGGLCWEMGCSRGTRMLRWQRNHLSGPSDFGGC